MEALDEIQWKSPEFIQERGLHTNNVLEYFALSPFYDRTSNNQVLMMQFQYQQIQIPIGMSFQQYFQSRLSEMTGIEFVIAYTREPDFWIVRKQTRLDPTNTFTLQDYYIIGANVYQAPRIYDVLSSRLLASVLSLRNSIDLLGEMTSYHISDGGHSYNNSIHNVSSHAMSITSSSLMTNHSNLQPKSASMTVSNTNAVNTMTPIPMPTPGPVTGPTSAVPASTVSNNLVNVSSHVEITSGAYDNLLNTVVQSVTEKIPSINGNPSFNIENDNESKQVYLDDIPLYGKGSTVEMLGVKVNLEED
ncbi:MED6 [[Candida] subhashii]|uniref:Mediator of RNA polymerase II transcription subunit 6 n=1 Tax=[Candida] subhashii TaxID=561895 RepID=A0A8J5UWR8_9ASCO|nr:MED6 [[Candida] subhashii]KAG7661834.1 MED6 [[Candida] subhashii]